MSEAPFLPERVAIDAYGNGGFRFRDMSHKGSLMCLPGGIFGWSPVNPEELKLVDFSRILENLDGIGLVLLGTGDRQVFPSGDIRKTFVDACVGLEPMATGAAVRTYNILLQEGRDVACALIAVDHRRMEA